MCLNNGPINELPFKIRISREKFESHEKLFVSRPFIESFENRIPVPKFARDIAPRATHSHSKKHSFDGQSKPGLVIHSRIEQYGPKLRPTLIREHSSGHGDLVFFVSCKTSLRDRHFLSILTRFPKLEAARRNVNSP